MEEDMPPQNKWDVLKTTTLKVPQSIKMQRGCLEGVKKHITYETGYCCAAGCSGLAAASCCLQGNLIVGYLFCVGAAYCYDHALMNRSRCNHASKDS